MANEFKVKKGLIVDGSNTVLDIQGTQGQLFSVTDSLVGDLFSISDISGIPIFNVNSGGLSTFDGDLTIIGNVTNRLKLSRAPGANNTDPTLAFGDGNTGFYERSDNDLRVAIGGVNYWEFSSNCMGNVNEGKAHLNSETATATNPSIIPWRNDSDTGIGRSSANVLSLIAGGTESLSLSATTATFISNLGIGGVPANASYGSIGTKLDMKGGADSIIILRGAAGGTSPNTYVASEYGLYSYDGEFSLTRTNVSSWWTAPDFKLVGGSAFFGGTVSAPYITANNSDGAANGSPQEVARFVNTKSAATSAYMYIGASSGTDWRLGKNIFGTSGSSSFGITKHSGTVMAMEIDTSLNTTFSGNVTLDNILLTPSTLPAVNTPSINLRSSNNEVYFQAGSANVFNFMKADYTTMLALDGTSTAAFAAATVTANGVTLTGDQTLPTDFVSAASGGTFANPIIVTGGGNTLHLKKGTGTPAIAFGGTSNEASFLIEGIAGGGGKMYTSTSVAKTIADPGWSAKMTMQGSGVTTFANNLITLGKLGVNHDAPTQAISVDGDIRIHGARSMFFNRHGDNYAWRVRNESASDSSTYGFNGSNDLVFEVVSNAQTVATPAATSHSIYASSANTLVLQETGRVGIGTNGPVTKLHVHNVSNSYNQSSIIRMGTETTNNFAAEIGFFRGTSSDVDRGLFLNATGSGQGSQQAKLLLNGNFGIGVTAPAKKLHVVGNVLFSASSSNLTSRSTSGVGISFTNSSTFVSNGDLTDANRFLSITNDSTTANAYAPISFRVNPNGATSRNAMADIKLVAGIDNHHLTTTFKNPITNTFLDVLDLNAEGGLDLQGSVGQLFSVTNSLSGDLFSVSDVSGIPIFNVNSSGAVDVDGTFTSSGDVVAFSDERLKTDVQTLDGSKVYEMRGVSFTKDNKKGSGVIAQELEKIAPELVNNDSQFKAVAYGNITGYLIEAIKDLKQEIEQLKKQIK